MAKTATEPAIILADFGLGERIFDEPNQAVIEGQNYTWTNTGSTILQHAFRPPYRTSSGVYTALTTDSSGYAEGLQTFWGSQIQMRRIESSGLTRNLIGLKIWGRNISVQLKIRKHGSGFSEDLVAVCGSTWGEASVTAVIDPATYTYGGNDDLYCFLQAKVTSGTGYIATISVTEAIATVAQMPRGR